MACKSCGVVSPIRIERPAAGKSVPHRVTRQSIRMQSKPQTNIKPHNHVDKR